MQQAMQYFKPSVRKKEKPLTSKHEIRSPVFKSSSCMFKKYWSSNAHLIHHHRSEVNGEEEPVFAEKLNKYTSHAGFAKMYTFDVCNLFWKFANKEGMGMDDKLLSTRRNTSTYLILEIISECNTILVLNPILFYIHFFYLLDSLGGHFVTYCASFSAWLTQW